MTYSDEVLADSPFAYFKFDETSGSSVSSAVNSYTGSVTGSLVYDKAGPKGLKAIGLNGSSFVSVASLPDFVNDGTFSFECWVKYGTAQADYPTFMRRDGNARAVLVRTRGPNTGSRVNEIEAFNTGQTVQSTPNTYNNNAWHHIVYVVSSYVGTLYINNVALTVRNGTTTTGGTGLTNTTIGTGLGSTEYFTGDMAGVAFYDTALSPTRIAAHYNATNDGPPAVSYFRGWGQAV